MDLVRLSRHSLEIDSDRIRNWSYGSLSSVVWRVMMGREVFSDLYNVKWHGHANFPNSRVRNAAVVTGHL